MKMGMFGELLEIEEDLTNVKLEVNTRFLFGRRIIDQKNTKKVGDIITYYLVTGTSNNGKDISYRPVYEKLEE